MLCSLPSPHVASLLFVVVMGSLARKDMTPTPLCEEYFAEHCQNCGKAYDYVYWVPNELWNGIVGSEAGILCITCFDNKCRENGIYLRWSCEIL